MGHGQPCESCGQDSDFGAAAEAEGDRREADGYAVCNLQTKYNEKEKELAKLQGRYDKVVMNGLPASPRTQNAMKDLRQSID